MSETSLGSQGYCTTRDNVFNYDLSSAPTGQKMLLLTTGHVAILGSITGNPVKDKGIIGWFPMPVRNKKREEELGL